MFEDETFINNSSRAEDTFNCFNQEDCTPKHSNQLTFFHRVNVSLMRLVAPPDPWEARAPCEDVTANIILWFCMNVGGSRSFSTFAVFTATIFSRASSLFRLALRLFVRRRSVSSNIRRASGLSPGAPFGTRTYTVVLISPQP